MNLHTDFSRITPCGGNCSECEKLTSGKCAGCLKSGGKCIAMWENDCDIFSCCQRHNAKFCGICDEFPCGFIEKTVSEWDADGIKRLKVLSDEFLHQQKAFTENLPALWKRIGSHGVMTLSSCSGSRVTSRPMSVVVIAGKFYCQTDESFLKWEQIRKNPYCALCVGKFSVEGKSRNIGRPSDSENQFFIKEFKKHFFGSYTAYSSRPTEILLEITPSLIYLWDYKVNKPFAEYYDFANRTYRKEEKN